MQWYQKVVRLPRVDRGYHLVTQQLLDHLPELDKFRIGQLHLFIQHTSAALTINENADPDVCQDFEPMVNRIVPEGQPISHTIEGPDDMPAHVKSSLIGSSLTIPIAGGRLLLGTWQGIYLCEFRNHGGPRSIVCTISGERDDA